MPDLDELFLKFHADNPDVYRLLVKLARELKSKGHRRIGIGMLFEVVRWKYMLSTIDPARPAFKLNNNYRSRYARLIEHRETDLQGVFEMRELQT